ncbi:MAG: type III restriction endonuclease subunit R, partial [Peptostreptococcaceae bacterium]
KLDKIRNFATSSNIQIMIINIDAFRKGFGEDEEKSNIIHRRIDSLNGQRPIDLIKETNPIVIIDEPQSVDSTEKSKEAIKSLNALCTLRYSATHIDKHNMIYRLDAVDAYKDNLVKKIEVLSIKSEDNYNMPYIKLVKINQKTATIEIDVVDKNGMVKRTKKNVKHKEKLFVTSGEREIYRDYIVENICCEDGNEYIEINGMKLKIDDIVGDTDTDEIRRVQIRQTIKEHLNKEMELNKIGIKVLSLFFIDKVCNYREYLDDGIISNGKYANMFEEEYSKLIKSPKFKENINKNVEVSYTHNGYFASDNKKKFKDTKGNTKADEDVYNLIMKDKEKLLDLKTPLRFIFSHSALREGWDNPNVFQICTLRDSGGTYIKKRQEIGRGLRLCVNQDGDRIKDNKINILTVMANESYEDFAKDLQSEIQNDCGVKFGIIENNAFANIKRIAKNENDEDEGVEFGYENSEKLFDYLVCNDYIDEKGRIQDKLKLSIEERFNGQINILEDPKEVFTVSNTEFEDFELGIYNEIRNRCRSYEIKNCATKKTVRIKDDALKSPEFVRLWEKINTQATYSVNFKTYELVEKMSSAISKMETIKAPIIYSEKNKVDITRNEGVTGLCTSVSESSETYTTTYLPDIITELQNRTQLTRKSIVDILIKSNRLDEFRVNPQKFIETVIKTINSNLKYFLVDGIKYEKIDKTYSIEKLKEEYFIKYENNNVFKSEKSPFEEFICDSNIEMKFAEGLENNEDIKVYLKLPSWFKIDTPVGTYNPDWALLIEKDFDEKLYFIVETKGTKNIDDLREDEKNKIKCAEKCYEVIGDKGVEYRAPIETIMDFLKSI